MRSGARGRMVAQSRRMARTLQEEKRREHYKAQVQHRALTRAATDRARLERLKASLPRPMVETFGAMFAEFDADGNGILTRAELISCLATLGVCPTEPELTEWLLVVDDQHGALGIAIDIDEWMALMAMLVQPPFAAAELRAMVGHFVALQREQDERRLTRLRAVAEAEADVQKQERRDSWLGRRLSFTRGWSAPPRLQRSEAGGHSAAAKRWALRLRRPLRRRRPSRHDWPCRRDSCTSSS